MSLRKAMIAVTLFDFVEGIAAGGLILFIVMSKKLVISLGYKSLFKLI